MNKLPANIVFMIVIIVIIVFLGKLFIVSPIISKIDKENEAISKLKIELEKANSDLEKLPEKPEEQQEKITLIYADQEGQLMRLFLNKTLEESFKINTYDLYSSYFYKPEITEQADITPAPVPTNSEASSTENLSQLDSNGMPLDAYTETDESEWAGLEIAPVKITFTARAEGFTTALRYFWALPTNAIRTADFIFDGKIIKGTMVFAFPLNE